MLNTEFDVQEGITVPYPPLFDDIRRNHGFVDLSGRPDLAAEIVEGSQSPALKDLLVGLAGTSAQAQQRLLTCWYNEKNVYTGADDAQPGAKLGLAKTGTSGDYTWGYTMRGVDGGSCPRVRPQS